VRGEIRGFFNTLMEFNWDQIDQDFKEHIQEVHSQQKRVEVIKVYKNGEVTEQVVDNEMNERKVQAINNIINKNKCSDILKELKAKNDGNKKICVDHELEIKKKFYIKNMDQTLLKL
jgi:hypothetical protein